jgi:hypothetical protein
MHRFFPKRFPMEQMIQISRETEVPRNHDRIRLHRILKTGSILILLIFFFTGIVLFSRQFWEFKKESVKLDFHFINDDIPAIYGVSHTSYAIGPKKITTKAESISVRNRRFNRLILNFCKDIIISDLHVKVRSEKADTVMDWAKDDHLESITSLLFFDYRRLRISNGISKIYFRFMVDQLKVDLIPNDSEASIFTILADSMLKEGASNELTFKGNFRILQNDSKLFSSSLAIWNFKKNQFYFPDGFITNEHDQLKKFDIASIKYDRTSEIKSLIAGIKPNRSLTTTQLPLNSRQSSIVLNKRVSSQAKFERLKEKLSNLDEKTRKMIVLELLATNPSTFNLSGITPASFLFPNFRLGAFDAGPFVAGL